MKNLRNLMILLMMVVGVNLFAQSPTNVSSRRVTCPLGTSVVGIKYTSQQGCCPSCPVGKVARVDDKYDTKTNKTNDICICKDQAYIDQRYKDCMRTDSRGDKYCTEWAG